VIVILPEAATSTSTPGRINVLAFVIFMTTTGEWVEVAADRFRVFEDWPDPGITLRERSTIVCAFRVQFSVLPQSSQSCRTGNRAYGRPVHVERRHLCRHPTLRPARRVFNGVDAIIQTLQGLSLSVISAQPLVLAVNTEMFSLLSQS
jgi:hypothetical protein